MHGYVDYGPFRQLTNLGGFGLGNRAHKRAAGPNQLGHAGGISITRGRVAPLNMMACRGEIQPLTAAV